MPILLLDVSQRRRITLSPINIADDKLPLMGPYLRFHCQMPLTCRFIAATL